jgi:hypothetical protein
MKSKTYNGAVRRSEKDFETLQLGAFATPGLLLAQGPVGLTAESGIISVGSAADSLNCTVACPCTIRVSRSIPLTCQIEGDLADLPVVLRCGLLRDCA